MTADVEFLAVRIRLLAADVDDMPVTLNPSEIDALLAHIEQTT